MLVLIILSVLYAKSETFRFKINNALHCRNKNYEKKEKNSINNTVNGQINMYENSDDENKVKKTENTVYYQANLNDIRISNYN
jgi:hypothetical protein